MTFGLISRQRKIDKLLILVSSYWMAKLLLNMYTQHTLLQIALSLLCVDDGWSMHQYAENVGPA